MSASLLRAKVRLWREVELTAGSEHCGIAKVYAEEVAWLSGALGPGQGIVEDWWLWWDHVQALDASGGRDVTRPDLWAWAADAGDEGLAAAFVRRAAEAKAALVADGGEPQA